MIKNNIFGYFLKGYKAMQKKLFCYLFSYFFYLYFCAISVHFMNEIFNYKLPFFLILISIFQFITLKIKNIKNCNFFLVDYTIIICTPNRNQLLICICYAKISDIWNAHTVIKSGISALLISCVYQYSTSFEFQMKLNLRKERCEYIPLFN